MAIYTGEYSASVVKKTCILLLASFLLVFITSAINMDVGANIAAALLFFWSICIIVFVARKLMTIGNHKNKNIARQTSPSNRFAPLRQSSSEGHSGSSSQPVPRYEAATSEISALGETYDPLHLSTRLGCPSEYANHYKRYSYNEIGVYVPDIRIFDSAELCVGTFLEVLPDTSNPYDATAVALLLHGRIVGYLYRNDKRYAMANDWFRKRLPILAQIEGIERSESKLRVILAFYDVDKLERMLRRDPTPKAYRLTRTSGSEAQESIGYCSENDEVTIKDDLDSGGFIVTSVGTLGCLPTSAARLVEKYGGSEKCCAFVAEKNYTESGKETISVWIFKE